MAGGWPGFLCLHRIPWIPRLVIEQWSYSRPAGHQFYDLRWMRDSKYLKSYAEYWLAGPASHKMQHQNNTWLATLSRPQSHHYTSWMVDASEAMLKVHPDAQWRDRLLPAMEEHQRVWGMIFGVSAPGMKTDGLYKCLDMYDANEFTISTTLGLIAAQGAFLWLHSRARSRRAIRGDKSVGADISPTEKGGPGRSMKD